MITLDNTPWPDEKSGEPVAVKAGSLVIFHGLLPHYSAPNRSSSLDKLTPYMSLMVKQSMRKKIGYKPRAYLFVVLITKG